MAKIIKAPIQKIERIESKAYGTDAICTVSYRIYARSAEISACAVPGQFIHARCGKTNEMVLRRPFSICGVNRVSGIFDFAFRIKGKGTEILANAREGDMLDIMGPLGNGFTILPECRRIAVVGGGIGIFPLVFLVNELRAMNSRIDIKAYTGFKDASALGINAMIQAVCDDVRIATEDGCEGMKGLVTAPFKEGLVNPGFDVVYSCGPSAMMREVAAIAGRYGARCQVSLEERMGCGIGACMVCSCRLKTAGGDWKYGRVCKDGPVFWSDEVLF